eukprot:5221991-Pleurochrysis_carterae.AAC.1
MKIKGKGRDGKECRRGMSRERNKIEKDTKRVKRRQGQRGSKDTQLRRGIPEARAIRRDQGGSRNEHATRCAIFIKRDSSSDRRCVILTSSGRGRAILVDTTQKVAVHVRRGVRHTEGGKRKGESNTLAWTRTHGSGSELFLGPKTGQPRNEETKIDGAIQCAIWNVDANGTNATQLGRNLLNAPCNTDCAMQTTHRQNMLCIKEYMERMKGHKGPE